MPTLHPNQRSYSAPLTCLQNLWNFTKLYLLEWNKDPNNFFYFKRSKIRKCTSRVKIFTPWRCSELQVLRVLLYEPLNEVHLLQSQLDRVEMLRLARHVSRPKLCKRILWLIRRERERRKRGAKVDYKRLFFLFKQYFNNRGFRFFAIEWRKFGRREFRNTLD